MKRKNSGRPESPSTDPVRSSVRFPLRLQLEMKTEFGTIQAMTENVSAGGVLFTMDRLPAIGSRVEFTLTMPGKAMGSPKDVTVKCIGRIVRHEQSGTIQRAAAVIDEYTLKA